MILWISWLNRLKNIRATVAIITLNIRWEKATCPAIPTGSVLIKFEKICIKGMNNKTPIKLNKKWARAILLPCLPVTREAKIAVVEVPMFEPSIIPNAWSKFNIPCIDNITTILIVIELDCSIVENKKPAKIAINKFEVLSIIDRRSSLWLKELVMTEIIKRQENIKPK